MLSRRRSIRSIPSRIARYEYWHVFVCGIGAGQVYGYRVCGAERTRRRACASIPQKLLLDPYALAVANSENYQRAKAAAPGDNTAYAMKSVVVDPTSYDWEGDTPHPAAVCRFGDL